MKRISMRDRLRELMGALLAAALICCFIMPAGLAWADPVNVTAADDTLANDTLVAEPVNGTDLSAAPATSEPAAQEVLLITIKELVSDPMKYDNMVVQVSGEAVGDIINSSNARYKWVNISADGYSLGVYMETGDTYDIRYLGAHGVRGTTIIVTGTFHAACAQSHAGELDLHADHVSVKFAGGPFEHDSMTSGFQIGAVVLLLIGIEFYLFYAILARRAAKAAGVLTRRERGRGIRALLPGGDKSGDGKRGKRGGGKRPGKHSGGKHGKR